jgi:hypothetical protein
LQVSNNAEGCSAWRYLDAGEVYVDMVFFKLNKGVGEIMTTLGYTDSIGRVMVMLSVSLLLLENSDAGATMPSPTSTVATDHQEPFRFNTIFTLHQQNTLREEPYPPCSQYRTAAIFSKHQSS